MNARASEERAALIEAVRRLDNCLWAIGDALVEEIDNNGYSLNKVLDELSAEPTGHNWSVTKLATLRRLALDFPPDKRIASMGWKAHYRQRYDRSCHLFD